MLDQTIICLILTEKQDQVWAQAWAEHTRINAKLNFQGWETCKKKKSLCGIEHNEHLLFWICVGKGFI